MLYGINSASYLFIRLRRKIKNINISLKFMMLTDNNKISRNWFVIIHRHLTKVSAQIIQCIIFGRNELSITLSTLWFHHVHIYRLGRQPTDRNQTQWRSQRLQHHDDSDSWPFRSTTNRNEARTSSACTAVCHY